MLKMRTAGISLISIALTLSVVGNAYYQKKQFYPSVVYITKSNASMAVIYIQSLVLVLMLGKLMRKIFLGTLRAAEFEHLMERFWYALTETCLAFTVFRDDFNPKFVALFTMLLFLKSFHWLAEDRVDYMERSPVIGWLFHVRVAGLLAVLGMLDYYLISYAYQSTLAKGATVQLVFGFEYAILLTMVINTTIKYIFHAVELRLDTPWENKAVFLLYTELIIGLIRVILYVTFVVLMVKIYTLPLFAFRPMYYTMRNFKKALNDVILSRRAIRNMNTLYPDATNEELAQSDNICIICREDMVSSAKKLPCGHIFHTACLRSWFQRQQTCPTCRLNILRTTIPTPIPTPAANQNATPAPNAQSTSNIQSTSSNAIPTPNSTVLPTPPGMPLVLPPFPFMAPYAMPLPTAPPNLDQLTDEELRAMEGNERRHIEERIKLLQNIRTMLDASVALMNQYTLVAARLPPMPIPTTITPIPPTQPTTSTAATTTSPAVEPVEPPATESEQKPDSTSPKFQIEDLGSDEDDLIPKKEPIPSTSKEFIIHESDNASSNVNSSVAPASKSNISTDINESSEMSEIRRRRLERFGGNQSD